MLRHSYRILVMQKPEDERWRWLAGVLAAMWDALVVVVIVVCIGTYVLIQNGIDRTARTTDVNQKLNLTGCLALRYTPHSNPLHRELEKLYPHCSQKKK